MVKMLYLTTQNTLYSSHYLKNHEGKCGMLHGHQYEVKLTIKASYNTIEKDKCNFLIDLYDFDKIWKEVFPTDHVDINQLTGEDNPSVEFLSKWIYDKMKIKIEDLYSVEIYETPTNSCTYIEEDL